MLVRAELAQLTGIAAILRFPMPDIELVEAEEAEAAAAAAVAGRGAGAGADGDEKE